ncbi:hypothetical protein JHS3_21210 [Jeongeupia sp. HS-3]|uniref:energy transducer TonB n=1 Tax=Jeongeupia sp. HS-3 TaxID=1009682 RepID=UPI0018A5665A|nr:energy transducer TonB [Jeongeupia sp. HS-3]BCL76385.1 hypothetical protein JHS3_21210 [Jeongeupia sp. HS-3]
MQLRYAMLVSFAAHAGVVAFGSGWLAHSVPPQPSPAMPLTVVLLAAPAAVPALEAPAAAVAVRLSAAPKQGKPAAAPKASLPAPQRQPVLALAPSVSRPAPTVPAETKPVEPVVADTAPPAVVKPDGARAHVAEGGGEAPSAPPSWPGYLANPEPEMPLASRQRGEVGKVVLKVRVGRDGKPLAVEVQRSSGFGRLDEAARKTVAERWHFIAARRGDTPVEADVHVPIVFRLKD